MAISKTSAKPIAELRHVAMLQSPTCWAAKPDYRTIAATRSKHRVYIQWITIIPVPLRNGWALNCEDAVTFADNALRLELQTRHPATWERIEARRAFVHQELGVAIPESTLLLSSTPLCLPPFWLASGMLLARA